MRAFFSTGILDARLNETLIIPIPKVPNPCSMLQLRPISLCNVVYKIISKVLGNKYEDLWRYVIRPEKDKYTLDELGPVKFKHNQKISKKNGNINTIYLV